MRCEEIDCKSTNTVSKDLVRVQPYIEGQTARCLLATGEKVLVDTFPTISRRDSRSYILIHYSWFLPFVLTQWQIRFALVCMTADGMNFPPHRPEMSVRPACETPGVINYVRRQMRRAVFAALSARILLL